MDTQIIELLTHSLGTLVDKVTVPGGCDSDFGWELGLSSGRSNASWSILQAERREVETFDGSGIARASEGNGIKDSV